MTVKQIKLYYPVNQLHRAFKDMQPDFEEIRALAADAEEFGFNAALEEITANYEATLLAIEKAQQLFKFD